MSDPAFINSEKETVKKVKRSLEGWREIILQLNSVVLWEKPWYPGIIVGICTLASLVLWLIDPSLLSTLSSLGIIITLLDYLVPTICSSFCNPDQWTGAKEKQFEDVCKFFVTGYINLKLQTIAFIKLKETCPKLYYSVTILSLAALTYIGNKINNLVLTYVIVTSLLLAPGLYQHGILHKCYQVVLHSVAAALKRLNGTDKLKEAKSN